MSASILPVWLNENADFELLFEMRISVNEEA